jgi:hypothetical protein
MNIPSGIKLDFIEFLKLAPKYFLPVLILSAVIVFSPMEWLSFLSLEVIGEKYKWIFSILFLISASMFLGGVIIKLYDGFLLMKKKKNARNTVKKKLGNLSARQKSILKTLLDGESRTITLPMNDGEVIEMERYFLIYRSSSLSKGLEYFDYCLQPVAEEILKKNKKIL